MILAASEKIKYQNISYKHALSMLWVLIKPFILFKNVSDNLIYERPYKEGC